jgi:hypothetical protein
VAEIINLRRARKAKVRAEADAKAAGNRAKHGRSKAERDKSERLKAHEERRLNAHKLGDGDGEP